jgi:hypothetical protein
LIRRRVGRAGSAAGLVLLTACAATPPSPAPQATAPSPVVEVAHQALPVTPVPVPEVMIVQAPPQSSLPAPAPPPPVNEEEEQALALLVDLQRYAVESGDDLKRELSAANQAMNRARNDANRIRLAMLLTLASAGLPDDPRALSLLEPLVGKTSASPLKQIATVLYVQIVERTRSVKEEQKKTAAAQEKLDALRAIERSLLLERSRNAGGGSAGGGGGTGR